MVRPTNSRWRVARTRAELGAGAVTALKEWGADIAQAQIKRTTGELLALAALAWLVLS